MLDIQIPSIQGQVQNARFHRFYPKSPLNHWIQSFWQLSVSHGRFVYRSMPDNCVDCIFSLDQFSDIFLIKPFLTAETFEFRGPSHYFGIRFRTLGHHGLIAEPAGHWQPSNVAHDLLSLDKLAPLFEFLSQEIAFQQRCEYASQWLLTSLKYPQLDKRLLAFIRQCYVHKGDHRFLTQDQLSHIGISPRQLRRLSQQYLGLSPKEFSRVVRFQSFLQALDLGQADAWADHYYDQPHFIKEFKQLAGWTPKDFAKMSVLYNSPKT